MSLQSIEFKKVAVIGSRDYTDRKFVFEILTRFFAKNPDYRFIVSGGAAGADILSEAFARKNNISRLVFRPEYKKYGKSATFKRNYEIINYADFVIAFQKANSRGTQHSIDEAIKQNKPVIVFDENKKAVKMVNIPKD